MSKYKIIPKSITMYYYNYKSGLSNRIHTCNHTDPMAGGKHLIEKLPLVKASMILYHIIK